jgi:hypothetical protein
MNYRVLDHADVRSGSGVIEDARIELVSYHARREGCTIPLRRVVYCDPASGEELVFLTNHFRLAATTIAGSTRSDGKSKRFSVHSNRISRSNLRWDRPQCRADSDLDSTDRHADAEVPQLKSRLGWSLSNLVALLRWNFFTYRDLWRWLDDPFESPPEIQGALNDCWDCRDLGQHPRTRRAYF